LEQGENTIARRLEKHLERLKREIEVITQGWTKADGTFIPSLKTKYNYKFNDITYTYEKVK